MSASTLLSGVAADVDASCRSAARMSARASFYGFDVSRESGMLSPGCPSKIVSCGLRGERSAPGIGIAAHDDPQNARRRAMLSPLDERCRAAAVRRRLRPLRAAAGGPSLPERTVCVCAMHAQTAVLCSGIFSPSAVRNPVLRSCAESAAAPSVEAVSARSGTGRSTQSRPRSAGTVSMCGVPPPRYF